MEEAEGIDDVINIRGIIQLSLNACDRISMTTPEVLDLAKTTAESVTKLSHRGHWNRQSQDGDAHKCHEECEGTHLM